MSCYLPTYIRLPGCLPVIKGHVSLGQVFCATGWIGRTTFRSWPSSPLDIYIVVERLRHISGVLADVERLIFAFEARLCQVGECWLL